MVPLSLNMCSFLSPFLLSSFDLAGDESLKSDRGKESLTKVAQSDSALIGGEKQHEQVHVRSGETLTLIILRSLKVNAIAHASDSSPFYKLVN